MLRKYDEIKTQFHHFLAVDGIINITVDFTTISSKSSQIQPNPRKARNMEASSVLCESCKEFFTEKALLNHIGHSTKCKLHYGSRFTEMKKGKSKEKLQKWRKENKEEELRRQREIYANDQEKREKKRQWYDEKQYKLAKEQGWNYVPKHVFEKKLKEQSEEKLKPLEVVAKEQIPCDHCKKNFTSETLLKHIGHSDDCKDFYGVRFDDMKKEENRKRVALFRKKNGTRKELDQQIMNYASNPKLREHKKKRYQEEKEEQKLLGQRKEKERIFKLAEERLEKNERLARAENLTGLEWLKKSFEKVFQELKNLDTGTKDKIIFLEKRMADKFMKVEAEIDYKIKRWRTEMERGFTDVRNLDPIFDDFTTGILSHNYGKPLSEQNRIKLIWHELKQSIEVKLEDLSKETGKSYEEIPWHSKLCNICKIYRDFKTKIKFVPPRFAHEQDPEMLI